MLLHIDGRNNTSPKVTSLIDKEKERLGLHNPIERDCYWQCRLGLHFLTRSGAVSMSTEVCSLVHDHPMTIKTRKHGTGDKKLMV